MAEVGSSPKYLITGGAGFIGSNLIKGLIQKIPNCQLLSIDDYSTGKESNHIQSSQVKYIRCNTGAPYSSIERYIYTFYPSIIFHLGEYSRITTSFEDILKCQNSNSLGTFNILEICKRHKIKLVYSGSSSKFGSSDNENLSPYAWFKSKNIELIKNYSRWFGLEYRIAYFYNVYGPGQIEEGKYATVIGRFQDQVRRGIPLTVRGDGSQTRDFTHINDIIGGLLQTASYHENVETYLGTGKPDTILNIAKAFNHPIQFVDEVKGERTSSEIPNSLRGPISWSPSYDIYSYITSWKKDFHASLNSNPALADTTPENTQVRTE